MPKLKAPLLSLGARGSLADTLTFTKTPSGPRVQAIPTHPDRQSLPQLYQRWRFRDANFYWLSLTPTQQAAYRSQRHPPNMTGHQRCIRDYLRNRLIQTLWLTLDEPSGSTLYDISTHANHATAFGTNSVPAVISQGRYFDGIDDYATIPNTPSITNYSTKTLMFWFYPAATSGTHNYLYHHSFETNPYGDYVIYDTTILRVFFALRNTLGAAVYPNVPYTPNTWQHLAYSWDGSTARPYLNGILHHPPIFTGTLACTANPLSLATRSDILSPKECIIDDLRIYRRPLSADHIYYIAHNERYPLPR